MKIYDHIATICVLIALALNLIPNAEEIFCLKFSILFLLWVGIVIVFFKKIKILK